MFNMERKDIAIRFGALIKQLRAEKGMSQGDLAKIVGCQPQWISHIETGKRAPDLKSLVALEKALGMNLISELEKGML